MQKNDCFYFGKITKTHGIQGGLFAFLDVDSPEDFLGIKSILIEIDGRLIPFTIENIQLKKKQTAIISIKGMDDEGKAIKMLNKELFLPLSYLPELKENNFYYHEVINFEVVDKNYGPLGVIKEIFDYPSQAVFSVVVDYKEILIPIVNEMIEKVDRENKIIYVDTPEGLIDVYLQ